VFIHGLAASGNVWSGQCELLGDRYDTISLDLRSHGQSPAVETPCSRDDLVADVIALLDREGIECAAIVGHSAGGVVAMQTAAMHPERVSALVLVGTASECNEKTAAWYAKTADICAAEGGEKGMKAMGLRLGADPVPNGLGLAHLCRAMRTLNVEPLTEAVAKIATPTLIIVGEKDFLGVGGSVILSRAIAGSELEIVPERGHGIYREAPEWFAKRVGDFFAAQLSS
jgi:pimeloyl-ACP methyl ester carboxylesterase